MEIISAGNDIIQGFPTHIEFQPPDVLLILPDFFDPSGHRIELAANVGTPEQMRQLHEVAPAMIDEWSVTKRAPKHAAWLHEAISAES